jgi:DNA-directed RNA polymerase specialized sigma subunit
MTPKKFLQQYQDAEKEIAAKLDKLEKYREMATKTTTSFSKAKVIISAENKIENIMTGFIDLENDIEKRVVELREVQFRVEMVIRRLGQAKHRTVLLRRYINGQTWEVIAVAMGITYQWVCELHGQALDEISKKNLMS